MQKINSSKPSIFYKKMTTLRGLKILEKWER